LSAASYGSHESQLKGKREVTVFWKYHVELAYLKDDLVTHTKLWLCRQLSDMRQYWPEGIGVEKYMYIDPLA
jgi:hypothetical protein